MKYIIIISFLCGSILLVTSTPHHHSQHSDWNNWGNNNWGEGNNNYQDSKFIEQSNKKVVLGFYQDVIGNKNIDAADKYISSKSYIQHNPAVPDGLEPMKIAMREWYKGQGPVKIDVHHLSAEGDLVWIHIRDVDPNTNVVSSIMDIFKLKNGKIIEHWDVSQEVPKESANSHPMF